MTHTSSLCPSTSTEDGPANCSTCWYKHHVGRQNSGDAGERTKWVSEWVSEIFEAACWHSCKANKRVHESSLNVIMCTHDPCMCIYAKSSMYLCVCISTSSTCLFLSVCVCVCACVCAPAACWVRDSGQAGGSLSASRRSHTDLLHVDSCCRPQTPESRADLVQLIRFYNIWL